MPRKPRFFLPDVPVHAIQRGNNRQAIFFKDDDYAEYLKCLENAAAKSGCRIHAYVLMTNHIHLLLTPASAQSVSELFQNLGRHYVSYINQTYQRTGTLWEGRFKASLIDAERYLLSCYRYIELNPVRAGMVRAPEDYAWSSYRANALGEFNEFLQPHMLYVQLADTPEHRQAAYSALFADNFAPAVLSNVRECLQTGTPLGDERFRVQIEQALNVRVGYSRRGRPSQNQV